MPNTPIDYRSRYFNSSMELLNDYPDQQRAFEKLWSSGEIRKAYVFVTETVNGSNLTRSTENLKADEAFFWAYMH